MRTVDLIQIRVDEYYFVAPNGETVYGSQEELEQAAEIYFGTNFEFNILPDVSPY